MTIIKFRTWELFVDKELTKLTYDKVLKGCADSCDCYECKNFANYRENVYPVEIINLFHQLGIDFTKENEISHYCREPNGLNFYGGWFHFKGHFIGKDCTVQTSENAYTTDLTVISDNFNIGFRNYNALSFFENKENLVQVEIETKIPWTLEKRFESD
jgi:hypothetical protein